MKKLLFSTMQQQYLVLSVEFIMFLLVTCTSIRSLQEIKMNWNWARYISYFFGLVILILLGQKCNTEAHRNLRRRWYRSKGKSVNTSWLNAGHKMETKAAKTSFKSWGCLAAFATQLLRSRASNRRCGTSFAQISIGTSFLRLIRSCTTNVILPMLNNYSSTILYNFCSWHRRQITH